MKVTCGNRSESRSREEARRLQAGRGSAPSRTADFGWRNKESRGLESLRKSADNSPRIARLNQLKALINNAEPASAPATANRTGLPDRLKAGMENLSGRSLDHVRVRYNSSKPATVGARAFAQGSKIYIAPGQAKHLPHELGHVVQQAEGRVRPTTSVNGMAVNDDPGLESEATRLGNTALSAAPSNRL